MEIMVNGLANRLASFFDWVFAAAWSNKALAVAMMACFVVAQLAILGLIPGIIGGLALGGLAGTAIGKVFIENRGPDIDHVMSDNSPVVETELVPYDKWPDECYVCRDDIPDDMEIRGQFVIHKGESEAETKAVPLCEECTWTHSTLIDNHDHLVGIYDERQEPTEL